MSWNSLAHRAGSTQNATQHSVTQAYKDKIGRKRLFSFKIRTYLAALIFLSRICFWFHFFFQKSFPIFLLQVFSSISEKMDIEEPFVPTCSFVQKLSFGLGHVFNDLCAAMWFSYTLFYLHVVLNIESTTAGTLLMIGKRIKPHFKSTHLHLFCTIFSRTGCWFCGNPLGWLGHWSYRRTKSLAFCRFQKGSKNRFEIFQFFCFRYSGCSCRVFVDFFDETCWVNNTSTSLLYFEHHALSSRLGCCANSPFIFNSGNIQESQPQLRSNCH